MAPSRSTEEAMAPERGGVGREGGKEGRGGAGGVARPGSRDGRGRDGRGRVSVAAVRAVVAAGRVGRPRACANSTLRGIGVFSTTVLVEIFRGPGREIPPLAAGGRGATRARWPRDGRSSKHIKKTRTACLGRTRKPQARKLFGERACRWAPTPWPAAARSPPLASLPSPLPQVTINVCL